MSENFEMSLDKNEIIEITDTSSFQEAIKKEELKAANEWILLKRAIFDEWKHKKEELLDLMSPNDQQIFEESLKEKVRALDHRENELSKVYREKEMWPEAKEIISKSIKLESFEPRKNRLEDQSAMSYENISEAEGFR